MEYKLKWAHLRVGNIGDNVLSESHSLLRPAYVSKKLGCLCIRWKQFQSDPINQMFHASLTIIGAFNMLELKLFKLCILP